MTSKKDSKYEQEIQFIRYSISNYTTSRITARVIFFQYEIQVLVWRFQYQVRLKWSITGHLINTYWRMIFVVVINVLSTIRILLFLHRVFEAQWFCIYHVLGKKKKLHGLCPRANYTDRTTAACRRSDCRLLWIECAKWSAWQIPTAVFSVL
jgi:hypothetical protein